MKDARELTALSKSIELDFDKNDQHVLSLGLLKKLDDVEKITKRIARAGAPIATRRYRHLSFASDVKYRLLKESGASINSSSSETSNYAGAARRGFCLLISRIPTACESSGIYMTSGNAVS